MLEELAKQTPKREAVLTIGVFDGVHLGHQHLIKELNRQASRRGMLSGVVTFHHHPQLVLSPQSRPTYLTSLEERTSLIRDLGIELIVILSFTQELARLTARQFVLLLQEHLRMQGLVIGPNFALGRSREGNVQVLAALGKELQFTVDVVAPLVVDGQVASSTAIRKAVAEGDMRVAAKLLGRPFSLNSAVIPGDERGRILGFPTANLAIDPNHALPANGVYAIQAYVKNKRHQAVINIGTRPTFGSNQRTVEVHLLDFEGAIYGTQLKAEFVKRLRAERHFANAEELKAQISRDIEQARAILSNPRLEEVEHGKP